MKVSRKSARRRRDEVGAAMVLGALMFAFLALPLSALSVDTARWWVEAQRIQAAADAAATAGVTFMPDDFAKARDRAVELATQNGYTSGGATTVTVAAGDKPTQLKVTISRAVDNFFGKSIGTSTSTITRAATADFNGPAPMGSPCNAFANEPDGTGLLGPQTTQIKVPSPATCPRVPEFWGAISGPDVDKGEGSEFDARFCGGGEDGCSGTTNNEFDPRGMIYLVRVNPSGVGNEIKLQIYDPAHTPTGLRCADAPSGSVTNNNWNDYTTTDAQTRYARSTNNFCTGDDTSGEGTSTINYSGSAAATITSFGLRAPTDTQNPYVAPPVPGCVKQYPGYRPSTITAAALKQSTINDKLARVFHQWNTMCSFTPPAAGDYYLQVRTNVALGGVEGADGIYSGNNDVYNQVGDNTAVRGTGKNHFGLRAVSNAPAGGVSVAAYQRMRIYANASSATTEFNLVRVVPAAANKTLVVTFFDVGEGASSGTVTMLPPGDSNLPSSIAGCTTSGVTTTISNCAISNITSSNYNGKLQTIRIPIPNSYTCQVASQGGCWFKVRVGFGSGTVQDSTTWTAKVVGEPVRLIE